jgi:hypothetical protein
MLPLEGTWPRWALEPLPHVMLNVGSRQTRGQVGPWIRPTWVVRDGDVNFWDVVGELVPPDGELHDKIFPACNPFLSLKFSRPEVVCIPSDGSLGDGGRSREGVIRGRLVETVSRPTTEDDEQFG